MVINRVLGVALRQFYLIRGSFTRIIPLFVWAAIDIVLWGFITRYLNTIFNSHTNFIPMILGAVLLWDFLVRVMQGTAMAFMEDSWSRNFLNLFATPVSVSEYLAGLVLASIATSMVGLAVMLALAIGVFGLSFFAYGLLIIPFLFVLFLFGIALGILGCAIMLRLGPAAEWFVWPIPALLSPFACVFYPLATLPGWMQMVAYLLPPTYVFEGIRAIAAGHVMASETLYIGLGLAAGYILLACWCFTCVYRYAVRNGLIARYSAETTT